MVTSYCRGHKIYYDEPQKQWLYTDTRTICDDSRPCKKCNCYPTKEGYDACTGYIEGVSSFCCGHGVHKIIKIGNNK